MDKKFIRLFCFLIFIFALSLFLCFFSTAVDSEEQELCEVHSFETVISKATTETDGEIKKVCSVCGFTDSFTPIHRIAEITPEKTEYLYTGKIIKPAVRVTDSQGNELTKGIDFKIDYSNARSEPGVFSVLVKFKGNYKGSAEVEIKVLPEKVTGLTASKIRENSLYLSWDWVFGADKYIIYKHDGKNWKKVSSSKSLSSKIDGLSKNTKYKFKVRAYSSGGCYGPFSDTFTVKTIKSNSSIPFYSVFDGKGKKVKSFEADKNNPYDAFEEARSYTLRKTKSDNIYRIKFPKLKLNWFSLDSNVVYDLSAGTVIELSTCIQNVSAKKGGYSGLKNVTIKGGTFKVLGEIVGFRFAHAKSVAFNSVKFNYSGSNHIIELAACKNVRFKNCTFSGSGEKPKKSGAEAIQLDVLDKAKHFSGADLYDGTMNDGIYVSGCIFKNLSRGVGSRNLLATYYQKNFSIEKNTFSNLSSSAIVVSGCVNVKIKNNKIDNCGGGIDFYEMTGDGNIWQVCVYDNAGKINKNCNSAITENTITVKKTALSSNPSAIYVCGNTVTKKKDSHIPSGDYFVGNLTIEKNNISTPCYGIRLFDTKNSSVLSNTIKSTSNAQNAIYMGVKSDSNTLLGNTINGRFDAGFVLNNCSKNVLKSNKISSPVYYGMNLIASSMNNYVTYNTISNSGSSGINIVSSSCAMFCNNKIIKSKKQGLALQKGSKITDFKNNTITGSKLKAVYVDSDSKITNQSGNKLK